MTKYVALTALSVQTDQKKHWRTKLVRVGQVVELSGEAAESLLERGGIREVEDEERDANPGEVVDAPTGAAPSVTGGDDSGDEDDPPLPERPSNGASTEAWRTYVQELSAATEEELGEIEVPGGVGSATRAELIAAGDTRLDAWNEG